MSAGNCPDCGNAYDYCRCATAMSDELTSILRDCADDRSGEAIAGILRHAASEIERLRARLEWREDGYDGIYCRDETIRQLDKRVDELRAEVEALRAALRVAEAEMTCRNGNSHYCPNCDRSLYRALHDVRAALAAPKEEA